MKKKLSLFFTIFAVLFFNISAMERKRPREDDTAEREPAKRPRLIAGSNEDITGNDIISNHSYDREKVFTTNSDGGSNIQAGNSGEKQFILAVIDSKNEEKQVSVPYEYLKFSPVLIAAFNNHFIEGSKGKFVFQNYSVEQLDYIIFLLKLCACENDRERRNIIINICKKYNLTPEELCKNCVLISDYLDLDLSERCFFRPFINPDLQCSLDLNSIEDRIRSFPQEFQPCLAKYHYLFGGIGRHFACPELDYGFSIQELIDFQRLPQITRHRQRFYKLDLSHMRINSLEGLDAIVSKQCITHLDFSDNKISELPKQFEEFSNLVELKLFSNNITEIPKGCFDKLNRLEYLDLSGNKISELPKQFNELSKLVELKLFSNNIAEIPKGCFDKLNSLEHLDLGRNFITEIPKSCFDRLIRLIQINLSNYPVKFYQNISKNQQICFFCERQKKQSKLCLKSFEEASNAFYKRLQEWRRNNTNDFLISRGQHLFGSQIQELPEDCFDNHGNLNYSVHHVGLRRNQIKKLPAGCFSKNKRLRLIILGDNKIQELPCNCFDNLKQLRWLDLSHNKLKASPKCSGARMLRGINLSHNELTELPEDCFLDAAKLEWIDISHNALRKLPSNEYLDKFDHLKKCYTNSSDIRSPNFSTSE